MMDQLGPLFLKIALASLSFGILTASAQYGDLGLAPGVSVVERNETCHIKISNGHTLPWIPEPRPFGTTLSSSPITQNGGAVDNNQPSIEIEVHSNAAHIKCPERDLLSTSPKIVVFASIRSGYNLPDFNPSNETGTNTPGATHSEFGGKVFRTIEVVCANRAATRLTGLEAGSKQYLACTYSQITSQPIKGNLTPLQLPLDSYPGYGSYPGFGQ